MRNLSLACLVLLAVAACKSKPDRAAMCKEIARQGMLFADGLAKGFGVSKASEDPEIKSKMAELERECLGWPQDVFDCMRANDESSPKCVDAMSAMTGVKKSNADKAPEGPAVIATSKLEDPRFEGYRAVLGGDGTLFTLEKEGIRALDPAPAQRWHVAMKVYDWFLALPDASLLVTDLNTQNLVALDRATGREKWRAAIPSRDNAFSDNNAEAAVIAGDKVIVALADGRFLRLDPKAKTPALSLAFQLSNETLTDPQLLAMPDGDLVIGESELIRRVDAKGKAKVKIHVRDSLGGFALTPKGVLAAVMDDELVLWNLGACASGDKIALPRKPGHLYIKGEGECDDCIAPPTGCLVARPDLGDVDHHAPLVLKDGSIVVTTDRGLSRVMPDGSKAWTTEVSAFGDVRETPAGLIALTSTVGDDLEDAPARIVAIDPETSTVRWQRTLGFKTGGIVSNTDMILETNGPWIAAGYKGALAWLRVK